MLSNNNITILVVEDEEKIRKAIKDFLLIKKYNILDAADGMEALKIFEENIQKINLIILDLCLPKINENNVAKTIREKSNIPIIMLTAMSTVEDQIKGFENGADDYLTKPFSLAVLEAHIQAVLKRAMQEEKVLQIIKKGILEIDKNARSVKADGEDIPMTTKEFDVLLYMMEHEKMILKRGMLLDAIWGYDYIGDERTVDTIIKQIRSKISDKCQYIRTIYGEGYIFEVK